MLLYNLSVNCAVIEMVPVETLPLTISLVADFLSPQISERTRRQSFYFPVYGPICTPHPNCSCPFLRLISPPVLETLSVFIPHHLTPSSSYGFWNQPWPLSHLFPLLISFIFQEKLSLELTPLSSYRPVSVCPLKPSSLIEMSALPSLPPHW